MKKLIYLLGLAMLMAVAACSGSAEKKKVKHKYDQAVEDEKFRNKQAIYHIKVHKQAEQAMNAVRKDPSPENALRLVDVLDGIEREWKDEA